MIKPEAVKEWIYKHDEDSKFGVVRFDCADGSTSFQVVCADALRYTPDLPAYFQELCKERNASSFTFVACRLSFKKAEAWSHKIPI